MKSLKKVLFCFAALVTFSVVTGITPIAEKTLGAETALAVQRVGMVSQGSRGADTQWLQRALRSHGHTYIAADGIFGPATKSALQRHQRDWGLVADGIAGRQTWNTFNANHSINNTIKNLTFGGFNYIGP